MKLGAYFRRAAKKQTVSHSRMVSYMQTGKRSPEFNLKMFSSTQISHQTIQQGTTMELTRKQSTNQRNATKDIKDHNKEMTKAVEEVPISARRADSESKSSDLKQYRVKRGFHSRENSRSYEKTKYKVIEKDNSVLEQRIQKVKRDFSIEKSKVELYLKSHSKLVAAPKSRSNSRNQSSSKNPLPTKATKKLKACKSNELDCFLLAKKGRERASAINFTPYLPMKRQSTDYASRSFLIKFKPPRLFD